MSHPVCEQAKEFVQLTGSGPLTDVAAGSPTSQTDQRNIARSLMGQSKNKKFHKKGQVNIENHVIY